MFGGYSWGSDEREGMINKPPRKEFKNPYQSKIPKSRIRLLKNKVKNYVINECNVGGKHIANNNNIKIFIDDDLRRLIIKAEGDGKMCLPSVDRSIIQEMLAIDGIDYIVHLE